MRRVLVVFAMLPLACGTASFTLLTGSDSGAPTDSGKEDTGIGGDGGVADSSTADSGSSFDANVPFACPDSDGDILCTTFDDAMTPGQGWTGALETNGVGSLDTTEFVSSPQSYLASVTGIDGGGAALVQLLDQELVGQYATYSARAAIRIHTIDLTQNIPLLQLSYSAGSNVQVGINASNGDLFLVVVGPGASSQDDLGPYTLDKWFVARLDFALPPTTSVTAYLDGAMIKSVQPTLPAPSSQMRAVNVGIDLALAKATITINIDDFSWRGF